MFLSRSMAGGVVGGFCAAIWLAIAGAFSGRPWWSALALYRADLWGLTPHPVIASSLHAAIIAGVTWLLGAGLAAGALFGLLAGALLPVRVPRNGVVALGAVYGLLVFMLTTDVGVSALGPSAAAAVPAWVRAVALVLIGAFSAGIAADRRQDAEA
jgi:xanthosine utilization system XapX-like protein